MQAGHVVTGALTLNATVLQGGIIDNYLRLN